MTPNGQYAATGGDTRTAARVCLVRARIGARVPRRHDEHLLLSPLCRVHGGIAGAASGEGGSSGGGESAGGRAKLTRRAFLTGKWLRQGKQQKTAKAKAKGA